MLEITGKAIKISRGDTAVITLTFSGEELPQGTRALITLKRKIGAMELPLWEKLIAVDAEQGTLELNRGDTDLDAGTYWWDARLLLASGEVRTPFLPQTFQVMEVVGRV